MLNFNASFNFFMFYGGTNFGFVAGAYENIDVNHYQPVTTSYDCEWSKRLSKMEKKSRIFGLLQTMPQYRKRVLARTKSLAFQAVLQIKVFKMSLILRKNQIIFLEIKFVCLTIFLFILTYNYIYFYRSMLSFCVKRPLEPEIGVYCTFFHFFLSLKKFFIC